MKLMTFEERQELEKELAGVYPAAGELVLEAVRAERAARTASTPSRADMARARALAAVPQVARLLLEVETKYATMRAALARVLHEYGAGDDYVLSDLPWELSKVGLTVQPELDEAEALAEAEVAEVLR